MSIGGKDSHNSVLMSVFSWGQFEEKLAEGRGGGLSALTLPQAQ